MNEEQKEIKREFNQRQEKYVYYIIALAVSSIGFSIYRTNGQTLKLTQIPLGIAILCWGVSIFCGLKFLQYSISILYSNYHYFEIINGNDSDIGSNDENIKIGVDAFKKAMNINVEVAGKYFNWQGILFYLGIVFFIVWHIVEMYFNTTTK